MRFLAIDIETTGLDWNDRILTCAWAWREGEEVRTQSYNLGVLDLFGSPVAAGLVSGELGRAILNSDIVFLHNASFDLSYLYRDGIVEPGSLRGKLFDTLAMARTTGARESVSLANLCTSYGIGDPEWLAEKGKRGKTGYALSSDLLLYNEKDAVYTLMLGERLWEESIQAYFYDQGEAWIRREGDFSSLCAMMRVRGKRLNVDRVSETRRALSGRLFEILRGPLLHVGIRGPSNREDILRWISGTGVLVTNRTVGGNPSVDEASLLEIRGRLSSPDAAILDALLEARGLEKSITTWVDGLLSRADDNFTVHPLYMAGGTVSFRLSCTGPNVQAIPGNLDLWDDYVSADYSQAELRLAAMYAGENKLAELFSSPGADVHSETARMMFGEVTPEGRSLAKRCNFASVYGGGAKAIAEATGITEDSANRIRNLHAKLYPRLRETHKMAESIWVSRGYLVLISGKRLYASPDDIERRPYKAFNQLIQGGIAEVVKEAMLSLEDLGIRVMGQIHDSIELETGVDGDTVRRVMDGVIPDRIRDQVTPRIKMEVDIKEYGKHGK